MEIFVFGSNLAGRHGAGAALAALKDHGAIYGCGEGIQGQSYAIPTKDRTPWPSKPPAGYAESEERKPALPVPEPPTPYSRRPPLRSAILAPPSLGSHRHHARAQPGRIRVTPDPLSGVSPLNKISMLL